MTIEMLKGKIHRATVVQAELDYVGSITVDEELLEAAGILEYEKVQIVDVNNGSRFETYTICGERGSGMICLNGAAARCVSTGDKIIIMAYAGYDPEEARTHKPAVVFVDEENKISRVTNYEKHGLLKDMAFKLLNKKETQYIGDRLHLIEVKDGEEKTILNKKVTFFDIGSTKAKQFGFQMIYGDNKVLTCCGDEPYNECEEKYAKGSDWMFHEAFCLYGQRDIFNPYEKHHSTVKDASELAEKLGVKNLVLYHTEDKNIRNRKELYGAEGREYYHGNLFVPDDLDVIEM